MDVKSIKATVGTLDKYRSDITGDTLQNERKWAGRHCPIYFQLQRPRSVAEPARGKGDGAGCNAVEGEPSIVSRPKEAIAFTFPSKHQLSTCDRNVAIIRDNTADADMGGRYDSRDLREGTVGGQAAQKGD